MFEHILISLVWCEALHCPLIGCLFEFVDSKKLFQTCKCLHGEVCFGTIFTFAPMLIHLNHCLSIQ